MLDDSLKQKYPWLRVRTTVEEYVAPDYYDKLLKEYVFDGKTDLGIFREFLTQVKPDHDLRVLELGCGPGRATDIALAELAGRVSSVQLVDLSNQMLGASERRFSMHPELRYFQDDSLHFLEKADGRYDIVFSLWSFSHSVHQVLSVMGMEEGERYVEGVLRKFFTTNLAPGADFFLIHFDSCSDEQRILMRQWKKVFPIFADTEHQSPSQQLVSSTFRKLSEEGLVNFKEEHLVGEKIVYANLGEAMETFMNFHLESYFNDSPLLPEIIEELERYFLQYITPSGSIEIRPGCFISIVKRLP